MSFGIIISNQNNAEVCYMDTDSLIVHIQTKDAYIVIADDLKKRFDTSNEKIETPLLKDKKSDLIGERQIMWKTYYRTCRT